MKLSRKELDCAALVFFSALLFVGSVVSPKYVEWDLALVRGQDKILHVVAYGGLCVLACRVLVGRAHAAPAHVLLGLAIAVGYGALLEGVQARLAMRNCSLMDVTANAAGACMGALVWFAAKRA